MSSHYYHGSYGVVLRFPQNKFSTVPKRQSVRTEDEQELQSHARCDDDALSYSQLSGIVQVFIVSGNRNIPDVL